VSAAETLSSFFGDRRGGQATPPAPLVPELTAAEQFLVAQACSSSGVLWLRQAGEPRWALAWHAWHSGAVHVVHGVGEQLLPLRPGPAELAVRSKDSGALLVTVLAQADVLVPGSPEWDAAAAALSAARLNAPEPAGQRERWATGALIMRLVPVRVLAAGAGDDASPSGAQPPPRGPATTTGRMPWHLGGRSGRTPTVDTSSATPPRVALEVSTLSAGAQGRRGSAGGGVDGGVDRGVDRGVDGGVDGRPATDRA